MIQNPGRGVLSLGLIAGAAAVGCATSAPPQSPVEQAAALERTECAAFRDDSAIADVLSGRAVERVEPLYFGLQSKSSNPRLEGAVLTIRPIRGATAEWLARSLECHGVERMLGRTVARNGAVDPFVLPGSMVTVSVRSSGDGFRVELQGATMEDSREILSRADAFAGASNGQVMATDLSGQ